MKNDKAKLLQALRQRFGQIVIDRHGISQKETVIEVEKAQLPEVCSYLSTQAGARLFTMTGADERELHGRFRLYYVFAIDAMQHLVSVVAEIDEADPTFPSAAAVLPAANWYEREVADLLGLQPQGHPNPGPLILHGDWPQELHPLRKDFTLKASEIPRETCIREAFTEIDSEDVTVVPVGPIHAGIIEPGHFRFAAVGDTILGLDAKLFYTHRGLEKTSEGMPLHKALFLAERTCGVCALSHAVAYSHAVEYAAEVELPPKALYLRTILLEMERLYNHIGDVGNVCAGFGFAFGISQGARLKEELLRLNERISGHRYLRGAVLPGGVRIDLMEEQIEDIRSTLQTIEQQFKAFTDTLLFHEISVNRMTGTGELPLAVANDLEVVGVAARASGRNIDTRRDLPYAAYDKLKFMVPVREKGDVLARVMIRIEESAQSFAIIQQALEALPQGEIQVSVPPIDSYRTAVGWVESPRGEMVHWLMTGPGQTIYRYRIRSAAYSNWPAVAQAVKGNIVPDFPLINKSFELCYACCDR